jgi:hypothetical protein
MFMCPANDEARTAGVVDGGLGKRARGPLRARRGRAEALVRDEVEAGGFKKHLVQCPEAMTVRQRQYQWQEQAALQPKHEHLQAFEQPESTPAKPHTFADGQTSIEIVVYYRRSTTQYHVYYYFGENPPIAYYVPRTWFPKDQQEYALKSAKSKKTKPPTHSLTYVFTIPNPHN